MKIEELLKQINHLEDLQLLYKQDFIKFSKELHSLSWLKHPITAFILIIKLYSTRKWIEYFDKRINIFR